MDDKEISVVPLQPIRSLPSEKNILLYSVLTFCCKNKRNVYLTYVTLTEALTLLPETTRR